MLPKSDAFTVRSVELGERGQASYTVVDLAGNLHRVTVPSTLILPDPTLEVIGEALAERHRAALRVRTGWG